MSAEDDLTAALLSRVGGFPQRRHLDPIARALARLGDPHEAYPVVHLTGTNGKTSTSRITESLLRAHGIRTGMFTSPDLGQLTQRICIGGTPLPACVLLGYWQEIIPVITGVDRELTRAGAHALVFFEALTILALHTFAREHVDVAIVEVGRGGAWDPTNVVDADVAVFTPIDLDHVRHLGRSVSEITAVKAGIIKPGSVVVSARQSEAAERALRRRGQQLDAEFFMEDHDFGVARRRRSERGQILDISGRAASYDELELGLHGIHQAQNVAVAIAATEVLVGAPSRPLETQAVRRGINTATSPGRLQLLDSEPLTIVDAAHNPHGAAALAAALREQFPARRRVAVVALLADKDHAGIFAAVREVFEILIVTTVASPRALRVSRLAASAIAAGSQVIVEGDARTAITHAREIADRDGVVAVFGSVLLASLALDMFNPSDAPHGPGCTKQGGESEFGGLELVRQPALSR